MIVHVWFAALLQHEVDGLAEVVVDVVLIFRELRGLFWRHDARHGAGPLRRGDPLRILADLLQGVSPEPHEFHIHFRRPVERVPADDALDHGKADLLRGRDIRNLFVTFGGRHHQRAQLPCPDEAQHRDYVGTEKVDMAAQQCGRRLASALIRDLDGRFPAELLRVEQQLWAHFVDGADAGGAVLELAEIFLDALD